MLRKLKNRAVKTVVFGNKQCAVGKKSQPPPGFVVDIKRRAVGQLGFGHRTKIIVVGKKTFNEVFCALLLRLLVLSSEEVLFSLLFALSSTIYFAYLINIP